ncbi:MAG: hypothetical protein WC860_08855 [Candidatus Margulisiibacteriota bacterium]|jgi:hypothetical protein
MNEVKYNQNDFVEINFRQLPLLIKFNSAEGLKKYILKTNKEKKSLLLNKKE